MAAPYAKLPPWVDYGLIPLVNVIVAFLVAGLVVLLVGENPVRAAQLLVQGAFGSGDGIGYTLFYATNFIFTGLCMIGRDEELRIKAALGGKAGQVVVGEQRIVFPRPEQRGDRVVDMNTQEELAQAFNDLRSGNFIREQARM